MNPGGDAADEVVRMSLEGVEVAARISGEGAKYVAVNLVAALKSEQKTRGKARLSSMLKSGKPLKVYEVRQEDLKMFAKEAKRYGVLYCVLKDKTGKNETVDVISRVEDASKIQRITERFKLAAVNTAEVKRDITRSRTLPDRGVKHETKGDMAVPERGEEKEATSNPSSAQAEKDRLSAPDSKQTDRSNGSTRPYGKEAYQSGKQSSKAARPSVREKLTQYRREYERSKRERSEAEKDLLPDVSGKPPKINKQKER